MKVVFVNLDPADPNRIFFVILDVVDDKVWNSKCNVIHCDIMQKSGHCNAVSHSQTVFIGHLVRLCAICLILKFCGAFNVVIIEITRPILPPQLNRDQHNKQRNK